MIVFDEIHLIPTELLRPCLKAVGYITKYLNSEALFLSATMPDYSKLFDAHEKSGADITIVGVKAKCLKT